MALSSVIPPPEAIVANNGVPGELPCSGPTFSVQLMSSSAAVSGTAREATRVQIIIVRSPCSEGTDVERRALGGGRAGGAYHQRVAVPRLIDAEVRKAGDAIHSVHHLGAGQRAGHEHAAVMSDDDHHRTVEAREQVAGDVGNLHLD